MRTVSSKNLPDVEFKLHRPPNSLRQIVIGFSIVGILFCLMSIGILVLTNNRFDRGQCVAARSTPTSLSFQVGSPISIQTNLSQQPLHQITVVNANKLAEVDQIDYNPKAIRELRFNLDNTILLINNLTWIDTKWRDVSVHPKGYMIAYIEGEPSANSVVRICNTLTNQQLRAFYTDETANSIRFSPNEKLFAINQGRGLISVYDTNTFAELTTFDVRDGKRWVNANQLAFSSDSALLAFAMQDYQENDCTIRVWDIKTSTQLAVLEGHSKEVLGLSFNSDETLLASASIDGTVRVWGIPR